MSTNDDLDPDLAAFVRDAIGLAEHDVDVHTRELEARVRDEPMRDREDGELVDPELVAWVDDVRKLAERDVEAACGRGVPPFRAQPPAPLGRVLVWTAMVAAVIAAIALAGVRADQAESLDTQGAPHAAQRSRVDAPADGMIEQRSRSRSPTNPGPLVLDDAPERALDDAPLTPVEVEAHPVEGDEALGPRPRRSSSASGPTEQDAPKETLEDRLRVLDERAQAAWRGGDTAAAERGYEEIIRLAGRRREAERAYAELFALARARDDVGTSVALWRAYVRRFPRGLYADDARASLCRQATSADAQACWRAYLQDFPNGAHRARAEQVLEAP